MPPPSPSYADWKAPAEDGAVLIWPDPPALLEQTRQNQAHLDGSSCRIQGVTLKDLRRRSRESIGADADRLLVATGHQTELYHPGVWVKDALIDAVAAALGGQAWHFAVDTDSPKHLHLRWPGAAPEPLTDDPHLRTAEWSGLLAGPTPRHAEHLVDAVGRAAAGWRFEPAAQHVLAALAQPPQSSGLSQTLTRGMHELDRHLGLRHQVLVCSPLWSAEAYLVFVHDCLARADELASAYNASLGEYRQLNRVRTPTRPMPNLAGGEACREIPFWLDSLATGSRIRGQVRRSGNTWALKAAGSDEFAFDPRAGGWDAAGRLKAWLEKHRLRLSPRALTLTTYLRLAVVDQFVHGIGGGRYDQVTDSLIARFYRIEPPGFAVTTATMYFPAADRRPRVCLPCLVHEGHQLKHRVLPQKTDLVARIDQAPRRTPQRYELFAAMHRDLAAAQRTSAALERWRQRFAEGQARLTMENDLFDRELFYALQPEQRLREMIERYRSAVNGG